MLHLVCAGPLPVRGACGPLCFPKQLVAAGTHSADNGSVHSHQERRTRDCGSLAPCSSLRTVSVWNMLRPRDKMLFGEGEMVSLGVLSYHSFPCMHFSWQRSFLHLGQITDVAVLLQREMNYLVISDGGDLIPRKF